MTAPSPASTPSDVQLKPCPFCGSAMYYSNHKINQWASCPTKGCPGAWQALVLDDPRQVDAWNRRSVDPAKAELVEALRKALSVVKSFGLDDAERKNYREARDAYALAKASS